MTIAAQPYLRKVEVLVGPLEEWRGGGDRKLAVKFKGNGTNEQFRIKFEVRSAYPWTANPTIVQIYNLSKELRAELHKKRQAGTGPRVEIYVGWENVPLTSIFTGTLMAATHQREGPDIVTTLMSLAGYGGIVRTPVSSTFQPNTQVQSIIYDIAAKIPGITVDKNNIQIPNLSIGSQGLTQFTSAKEALDSLARTYGFSWTVEKGVFYARDDNGIVQSGEIEISKKSNPGYLLRAEPLLKPPQQELYAVNISCTLNPFLGIMNKVHLVSDVNPQINGKYMIHNMTHTGDTHSSDWQTRIESQMQQQVNGQFAGAVLDSGARVMH